MTKFSNHMIVNGFFSKKPFTLEFKVDAIMTILKMYKKQLARLMTLSFIFLAACEPGSFKVIIENNNLNSIFDKGYIPSFVFKQGIDDCDEDDGGVLINRVQITRVGSINTPEPFWLIQVKERDVHLKHLMYENIPDDFNEIIKARTFDVSGKYEVMAVSGHCYGITYFYIK